MLADSDNWQLFNRTVNGIADFAYNYDRSVLPRNEIYLQYIVASGSDTSLGKFRRPDHSNPFVYEIKKLVDLAYNTTLPDLLRRYTFTPATLPTRSALQDEVTLDEGATDWQKVLPTEEILDYIRRHFMAQMNRAMTLPLLSNLTMTDVVEVRRFDEWEAFRDAQTAILRNPLGLVELLPKFSAAFDNFQGALSRWYAHKYQDAETQQRYANFVTFLLQLGGRVICATVVPPGEHYLSIAVDTMLHEAVEAIPKRVKGVVAKLMIGAYNVGLHQLDRERSYTVELMHSNQEVFQDEIRDLAHRLTDTKKDIPMTLGQLAEQGKE
jgi:hypothetical protein